VWAYHRQNRSWKRHHCRPHEWTTQSIQQAVSTPYSTEDRRQQGASLNGRRTYDQAGGRFDPRTSLTSGWVILTGIGHLLQKQSSPIRHRQLAGTCEPGPHTIVVFLAFLDAWGIYNAIHTHFIINKIKLEWCKEIGYLGVYIITAANVYCCSFKYSKQAVYRSFNASLYLEKLAGLLVMKLCL